MPPPVVMMRSLQGRNCFKGSVVDIFAPPPPFASRNSMSDATDDIIEEPESRGVSALAELRAAIDAEQGHVHHISPAPQDLEQARSPLQLCRRSNAKGVAGAKAHNSSSSSLSGRQSPNRMFRCEKCGMSYAKEQSLQFHIRSNSSFQLRCNSPTMHTDTDTH